VADPLQTLPIYTSLFNKLGFMAIVCTLIALAALPLMRKLTATHHAHQ
jgi:POT family proton-dependent oligopeptide transporter